MAVVRFIQRGEACVALDPTGQKRPRVVLRFDDAAIAGASTFAAIVVAVLNRANIHDWQIWDVQNDPGLTKEH